MIPAEIISILLHIFTSVCVCVCVHIYKVSNVYSYVKNYKAKMCTNQLHQGPTLALSTKEKFIEHQT